MQIVPDTNLLLRMMYRADPLHLTARRAVTRLEAQNATLLLLPQTLYEFWAVATRPTTARGGLGLAPAQARRRIRTLLTRFDLKPDPPDFALRWLALCQRDQVSGVAAHDARIVAAMRAHGITHLLTFNPADFARYNGLTVLEPALVVAAP